MNPRTVVLLLLLTTIASVGCGEVASRPAVIATSELHDNSISSAKTSFPFEHHFGVVRPGEAVAHRFPITNSTTMPWELSRIEVSCTCASTEASAAIVAPGATEFVTVKYRAPAVDTNDRRSVRVLFTNKGTPPLRLVVLAKVRHEIYTEPPRIDFGPRVAGEKASREIIVQNTSAQPWDGLIASPSADWLSCDVIEINKPTDASTLHSLDDSMVPAQLYRVVLTAIPELAAHGRNHSVISFATKQKGEPVSRKIPVELEVLSAVAAIPGRIFLGEVTSGQAVTKSILLKCAPSAINCKLDNVRLDHNLGDKLQSSFKLASNNCIELTVRYTPDLPLGGPAFINEDVHVVFPEHTIVLPITGSVIAK